MRPYAFGGLSLNGGGYVPLAGTVGTGLQLDTARLFGLAEFWSDDAAKQDTHTGHDIGIRTRGFYRLGRGWYAGAGVQWNRLDTSAYSKQAWHPVLGGGKDLISERFSMRAQLLYVLPGSDHINAVQGPEIGLWWPSPARRRHFFYRQSLGLYEFHQSAVPGNSGASEQSLAAFSEFTFMYRF